MTNAEFSRVRLGLVALGLLFFAVATAGCSGQDFGSVSPSPKTSPEVVDAVSSKKVAPAPKVPRGPDQAKVLQESAKK